MRDTNQEQLYTQIQYDATHIWETDCSLPRRHESYCKPGGNGHPAPEVMRG